MNNIKTREICKMALLLGLIVVGSYIKIPLPYGDYITLQFFFVLLTGLLLKPSHAFLTTFLYVVLGLMGLPVFAGGGGLHYIVSPTYGYLIGFIISATVISFISNNSSSYKQNLIACLIGLLITYGLGLTYKYFIMINVLNTKIDFVYLVYQAIITYLPKDILTVLLVPVLQSKIIKKIAID